MNLLSLACGCLIPIFFAGIVFVSEVAKIWMSWDFRYVGKSWFTIWRAERLYRDGDIQAYRILVYGKEAVAAEDEYLHKRYDRSALH